MDASRRREPLRDILARGGSLCEAILASPPRQAEPAWRAPRDDLANRRAGRPRLVQLSSVKSRARSSRSAVLGRTLRAEPRGPWPGSSEYWTGRAAGGHMSPGPRGIRLRERAGGACCAHRQRQRCESWSIRSTGGRT